MRLLLVSFALALAATAAAQSGGSARDRAYDELLATPTALQEAEAVRELGVEPLPGTHAFKREIDVRLEVPAREQADYAKRLDAALARSGIDDARPQYFLLIDRSPRVQAAFLYWRSPEGAFQLVGATPAATGRPGEYEHFLTPVGVFAHSLANPDFRAEGTRNAAGILGYGAKGMRVYDFGWVEAERSWDPGRSGLMRLQVHSTDPDLLEPMLGAWHSKGCIRIPALLNIFIDRYGLLDADYEAAVRAGHRLWMLREDRVPTATPGRWLVVVDSLRSVRPRWAVPRRQERSEHAG